MQNQKTASVKLIIQSQVSYVAAESKPESNYYLFSYKIRITNQGAEAAQLISRHWIICDGFGHREEVRGPGVVGKQPRIPSGQSFEYESACPLTTSSGSMKGSYQMQLESGDLFDLEIPEFFLVAPQALH